MVDRTLKDLVETAGQYADFDGPVCPGRCGETITWGRTMTGTGDRG